MVVLEPEDSTHYARLVCDQCGKFFRFSPYPLSDDGTRTLKMVRAWLVARERGRHTEASRLAKDLLPRGIAITPSAPRWAEGGAK